MTARELDELGTSLLAQAQQNKPGTAAAIYCPGCGFAHYGDCDLSQRHTDTQAADVTPDQMRRFGEIFG